MALFWEKVAKPFPENAMDFTFLFCDVDDFCQVFEPVFTARLIASGERRRQRKSRMSLSERMTILIAFHQSDFRTFKKFYQHLQTYHRQDFPELISYQRFVELTASTLIPLCAYLKTCFGDPTGIAFVDSTPLAVCGTKRIRRNRVFQGLAQTGRSSMGWFHGFKLHLIVNDRGELLSARLTTGNTDDRRPVPDMVADLDGRLFGDKGYISKALWEQLMDQNLQLITPIKKNMKNRLMRLENKLLLRKRSLIETINDQLKNISQVEHTRHRSASNFFVNTVAALISYARKPKKPSLNLKPQELDELQKQSDSALLLIP